MHVLGVAVALVCLTAQIVAATSDSVQGPMQMLGVQDLPQQPEATCTSQQVQAALQACKSSTPGPACCAGLESVYGHQDSPAARCLCYPGVLYASITTSSKRGIDFLGILRACKANSSEPFHVQWATADDSTCPNIPLQASTADLIGDFGNAVVLQTSVARLKWAWGNMIQSGELMQAGPNMRAVSANLLSAKVLQFLNLVILFMPVFFAVLHIVLTRFSTVYVRSSVWDQMISCHHAVYFVVYTLSMVPQTVLAMRALFVAWTGAYLASAEIPALIGIFMGTRVVLHSTEASVRSVIKRNWLVVVHHLAYFAAFNIVLWTQDLSLVALAIIGDLFACYEAPEYAALLAYRLHWPPKCARLILRSACVWYVITRVLQTVMLLYVIIGYASISVIHHTAQYIVCAILCGAFTAIQVHTLILYKAMDVKLGMRMNEQLPKLSESKSASGDVAVGIRPSGVVPEGGSTCAEADMAPEGQGFSSSIAVGRSPLTPRVGVSGQGALSPRMGWKSVDSI